MTAYDYRTGGPPQAGGQAAGQSGMQDSADGAKEQAKQAASTAADEGRHVADVAKNEAASVAQDAQEQARNLVDEARSQIEEQSRTQLDSLVSTLQGFAGDLDRMARGEGVSSGLARDVVTQASEKARSISSQLSGREPSEVLDQARDFARRRPGTFLLGALAAGVVAGRLARGAKDARSSSSPGGSASVDPSATATLPTAASTPGYTPGNPDAPTAAPTPPAPPTAGTAAGEPLGGAPAPVETPVYPEGAENGPGATL